MTAGFAPVDPVEDARLSAVSVLARVPELVAGMEPRPCYSIDLSVHGIETVDVEIRDVITELNRVPGVARTVYSCAGFGQAGTAPRNPDDHPPEGGHSPRSSGYVLVEFVDDTAKHAISRRLAPVFDDWDVKRGPYTTFRIMRRDRDDAAMRAAWGRVLETVKALAVDPATPSVRR